MRSTAPHFGLVSNALKVTLNNFFNQSTLSWDLKHIRASSAYKKCAVRFHIQRSDARLWLPSHKRFDVDCFWRLHLSIPNNDFSIVRPRVECIVCTLLYAPDWRAVSFDRFTHRCAIPLDEFSLRRARNKLVVQHVIHWTQLYSLSERTEITLGSLESLSVLLENFHMFSTASCKGVLVRAPLSIVHLR